MRRSTCCAGLWPSGSSSGSSSRCRWMPQHGWQRADMITAAEITQRLSQHVQLIEDPEDALTRGSAPAELFRVVGTGYSVGIIAAVSKPFCGACDRVRLTADGQIRNCLFARIGIRSPYAATQRRERRRTRRAVGGGRTGKAAWPRHQRPELPATRPAHVGDRRLVPFRSTRGAVPLSGIRGPRGTATAIHDDHRRQASAFAGLGCESSGCSTAGRTRRASGSLGRHIPDHQARPGAGRHR